MTEYPHVPVRIFQGGPLWIVVCLLLSTTISVGEASIGVNPKINNMIAAYRAAQFDLLWISDITILSEYTNTLG